MNIVYLIKLNRKTLPNKYIGSKSNCSVENSRIIDNRGNFYTGSSKDKEYKDIMNFCDDYTVQILAQFDNYEDALIAERQIHLKYDVVASPEYFNKSIATVNNFTNPEYATFKHSITNKIARLSRTHPRVLSGEWVGVSKGTQLSEETRKKIGRKGPLNPFYGKKHTEESKRKAGKKIGDAHRGKPKTIEQRKRMSEARKMWWNSHKKNNTSG